MSKNIVICSDGTGNTFDSRVTNITHLIKSLDVSDPNRQLVFYDQGVGTNELRRRQVESEGPSPALLMLPAAIADRFRPLAWITRTRGLLFGHGLKENVGQMYTELARRYEDGDHVFLFGFSRGAFTVRALAGLLHRCFLPKPESSDFEDRFERAWTLFEPMHGDPQGTGQLRGEHRPCTVHFLGVWDTVKSYGGVKPILLPHLRHNPDISHVRHALALDERRAWFKHTPGASSTVIGRMQ